MNEENKFDAMQNSKFSKFSNKLFRIILLNFCIFVSSTIGFFILTPGASMIAGYKMVQQEREFETATFIRDYFVFFKENLIKGFFIHLSFIILSILSCINLVYYLYSSPSILNQMGIVVIGLLLIYLIIVMILIYPLIILYPTKSVRAIIKIITVIIFYRSISIFLLMLKVLFIVLFAIYVPQLFVIFGIGMYLYICYNDVIKIQEKIILKYKKEVMKEEK